MRRPIADKHFGASAQLKSNNQSVSRNIYRQLIFTEHAEVEIKNEKVSLAPRNKENSKFRFFYNRDELPLFKLSEMGEITKAAEAGKFRDTLIGHYQYTEIKKLMEKS
mgnify:CR=1 FL=1